MQHYAKFVNGERVESIVEGVHFKRVKHPLYNTEPITQIVINPETEEESTVTAESGTVLIGYGEDTFEPPIPEGFIPITADEQSLYSSNLYIRGEDGQPVEKPIETPSLAMLKTRKLSTLERAAAKAYISGFYSTASGEKLYYDSEEEDQTLINGVYARTKEPDWETKERYSGVAPAGKAPIRARPTKESPATDKTVQILNTEGLKTLVDDLDSHLYTVKATHWQLQAAVATAETAEELEAIVWPE